MDHLRTEGQGFEIGVGSWDSSTLIVRFLCGRSVSESSSDVSLLVSSLLLEASKEAKLRGGLVLVSPWSFSGVLSLFLDSSGRSAVGGDGFGRDPR